MLAHFHMRISVLVVAGKLHQAARKKKDIEEFLRRDLVPRNSAARAGPNLRLVEIDALADLYIG